MIVEQAETDVCLLLELSLVIKVVLLSQTVYGFYCTLHRIK